MKTWASYRDRKTTGKRSCSAGIATATQRWPANPAASAGQRDDGPQCLDELRATSRRSLWSLQLFLTISIAAFFLRGFDLFSVLPESILQILGCPPPPVLAHIALAGYIFTAVTPLAIHLLNGEKPEAQWRHLGYRAAFYGFYIFSNTLTANFLLVFTTGVVLYLLEQASICFSITKANHGDSQFA